MNFHLFTYQRHATMQPPSDDQQKTALINLNRRVNTRVKSERNMEHDNRKHITSNLQKRDDYELYLVNINIVLYSLCFQIQRPLEPFLIDNLGFNTDSGSEFAKVQVN